MARARDTGTGARNHGTNRIHIYKGNCLGKAHANVLIIVVPFGSNFTGIIKGIRSLQSILKCE